MTIQKAIEILKTHNEWRRGAEIPMTDTKELGIAIDVALKTLIKDVKTLKKGIK
jgi:hypothetical protein